MCCQLCDNNPPTSVVVLDYDGKVLEVKLVEKELDFTDQWHEPDANLFSVETITLSNTRLKLIRRISQQIDVVTGASRRDALEQALPALWEQSKTFALAMCDINQLKRVNDLKGHVAGDELLKKFVETLQKQLRQGDNVYRFGGDEFVILFSKVDSLDILPVLRTRLAKIIGDQAAFGIAHASETTSAKALIALADSRMYSQKSRYL